MLNRVRRRQRQNSMIMVSLMLCWPAAVIAAEAAPRADAVPPIEMKTSSMQHMPGFLPLHWDARSGKLYLEIPRLNADMLYFDSLPYGTGSTDLGLDRGEVSPARLVRFERIGPRILLVQPNQAVSPVVRRKCRAGVCMSSASCGRTSLYSRRNSSSQLWVSQASPPGRMRAFSRAP